MNNYSLERVFVLLPSNTLPTTGTTATLAPNQVGVFLPNYTPATGANIAAAEYIFIAQGRPNDDLNLRSIKSDLIYKTKIKKKYKITSEDTIRQKIVSVGDWSASCGESVSLTLRLFSSYINTNFYNGMTRSVTYLTRCCECGESPCEQLTDEDIEDMVDSFVTQINGDNLMNTYINASRVGSGSSSELWITGLLVRPEVSAANNPSNFPYEYDTVNFDVFAQRDPFTTQDMVVDDRCSTFATATVLQTISFPRGTPEQVRQVEKENYAYKVPRFKTLYTDNDWNGLRHSNVVDGEMYDEYVIICQNPETPNNYGEYVSQDFTVRLFAPTGVAGALETLLETGIGDFVDKSGPNITTTTTSTSTSSSTTSTTEP